VKHVGYNMLAYGVATVASTLLSNHAERRRVARESLVGVAAVLQLGLLVFLLVWIPDRNLVGVFVAVSTLAGVCDGFWITQCACTSLCGAARRRDVPVLTNPLMKLQIST